MAEKERCRTKDGKPFYKLLFRDKRREFQAPVWFDSPFFEECDESWRVGEFYKIRATVRETSYGPKLELKRLREVVEGDKQDGFDPNNCRPSSNYPPEALAAEIVAFAKSRFGKSPLYAMIRLIFKAHRAEICDAAASRYHHHSFVGGLLEHTLSVAKLAAALAEHFCADNPALKKDLSREIVVAGAILHDLGKIFDSENVGGVSRHTVEGDLIGHAILGRDLIRKFAPAAGVDDETRVKLEHVVLTHARFHDWGAPTPPASLEAMLVHYADYADATFVSALAILDGDDGRGAFTQRLGPFGTAILRPGAPIFPNGARNLPPAPKKPSAPPAEESREVSAESPSPAPDADPAEEIAPSADVSPNE
ncbi:MAG: HD domain-containing protein [Thermoguttaceae bacterium]|nr:HD domain-containing protein [Thermoguttaceae bacterium]